MTADEDPAGPVINAGRLTLQSGLGFLGGTGTLTNTGVITGDGTIDRSVINEATGNFRAEAGKALNLSRGAVTSTGTLSLPGGMLDFTASLTNSAAGFISGQG